MRTQHPASMTAAEREAIRYRPQGWAAIRLADGESVIYYGQWSNGKVGAIAYRGRSINRAWFHSFRTEAARADYVQKFIANLAFVANRKATQQAERKAYQHTLEVGDILRCSWGYDQTNIDYYQVTRRTVKCVWIRAIGCQSKDTAWLQGESVPRPDYFTGPETRHVVTQNNSVRITSFSWAHKIEPMIVAGVKCFHASHWTAYA